MEDYTIVHNTLIFSDKAKERMTEAEIQAIFDHFIKVVTKNEMPERFRPTPIIREKIQVFDLTEIWKQKEKVSFGPCLVRVIPSNNKGLKVPCR